MITREFINFLSLEKRIFTWGEFYFQEMSLYIPRKNLDAVFSFLILLITIQNH